MYACSKSRGHLLPNRDQWPNATDLEWRIFIYRYHTGLMPPELRGYVQTPVEPRVCRGAASPAEEQGGRIYPGGFGRDCGGGRHVNGRYLPESMAAQEGALRVWEDLEN